MNNSNNNNSYNKHSLSTSSVSGSVQAWQIQPWTRETHHLPALGIPNCYSMLPECQAFVLRISHLILTIALRSQYYWYSCFFFFFKFLIILNNFKGYSLFAVIIKHWLDSYVVQYILELISHPIVCTAHSPTPIFPLPTPSGNDYLPLHTSVCFFFAISSSSILLFHT